MKKLVLSAVLMGGLTLSSCSTDEGSEPIENQVEIPATYNFTRNSNSTVSFDGQTTRLEMSKAIFSAFNDFDNTTQESLSNMFSNSNSPFSDPSLNSSDKSVKSKVAASKDYFSANSLESNQIKSDFESYINDQVNVVFPNENEVAAPGVAGQIIDGSSIRYVNSKGLELDQAFAKGLIGALLVDQMLNNYLSTAVLDEGDNISKNTAGIVEEGKNYTTMEHKWDEAYGYLYGDPSIPAENPNSVLTSSEDRLLFNYLGRVNGDSDFAGIADEVYNAFKTGRAAIVAGNYDLRDEQIEIIKENISKVIAVRTIYYLQKGKTALGNENFGNAFHQLSEGFGFLYSLRFTNDPLTGAPYLLPQELNTFKDQLLEGNGFWDVSPATLDTISERIATAFGITVAAAAE